MVEGKIDFQTKKVRATGELKGLSRLTVWSYLDEYDLVRSVSLLSKHDRKSINNSEIIRNGKTCMFWDFLNRSAWSTCLKCEDKFEAIADRLNFWLRFFEKINY